MCAALTARPSNRVALLGVLAALLLSTSGEAADRQTVRERLREPGVPAYSVVFGIVIGRDSKLQGFRVARVIDAKSGNTRAVTVDVPDEYVQAARRKVEAKGYAPKLNDGESVEFFTYFFYLPEQPGTVITDLDRPLDRQP
jgi:hypothetical protein